MDRDPSPLLAYSHGAGRTPLLGRTIGDDLRAHRRTPWRPRCSRRLLAELSRHLPRTVGPDHARPPAACSPSASRPATASASGRTNRYEWVVVQYATARVGAILVNINPAYQAAELEYALRQSGVSVLFHGQRLSQTLLRPHARRRPAAAAPPCSTSCRFDERLGRLARLRATGCRGRTGPPRGGAAVRRSDQHPVHLRHDRLSQGGHAHPSQHPQQRLLRRRGPRASRSRTASASRCLFIIVSGWFWATWPAPPTAPAWWSRANVSGRRPCCEAVQAERCTALYGVPTMFRAVLEDPSFADTDCSSLRTGIMAGSPCPVELMHDVTTKLHMPEVAIGYGMTETSPMSTMSATGRLAGTARQRRLAVWLPHIEICIRDPGTGAVSPRGEAGELCTRGYSVMRGYWDDEAATRAAIDAAGWMHSGDLAMMDAERLRPHRRPAQGHDHPRRREHLPARDRGRAAPASGGERGAGDRRAQPQVRRGGHGLGAAGAGRIGHARTNWSAIAGNGWRRSSGRATGALWRRSR